jgi:FixJ family two-component response regulator
MESTLVLPDDNNDDRDKVRATIRARIEAVSPDFATKLRQQYPILNDREIEICVLMKAELMVREIAVWLNVTAQTVYEYQKLIRSKMQR